MKRLAFLLAQVLLLTFFVSLAEAKVPSFKETPQYHALNSYVSLLQNLENTPATPEQKNTYTTNLTTRVDNARTRVAQLNTQRKTAAKNSFSRRKAKILKSARAAAKKQRKQALATYKRYSSQERAAYQAQVMRIQAVYDDDISRTSRQIKSLNKQLDKTNNPTKMLRIEKKINRLEDKLSGYKKARMQEKNAAQREYQRTAADEWAAYQRRLARISRRFQENLNTRNRQAKENYNSQLGRIENVNLAEKNTVLNLQTRGQGYIANMPAAN